MAKLAYSKPPLLNPLSVVLPNREQTWLLQACLWAGMRGEQAWAKWSKSIDDPARFLRHDKDGVKGLLPLLFHSLQDKKVSVGKEFYTYLRTAYLRDELRSWSYSRISRTVTAALVKAGITAVLLKGGALSETAYEDPVLQHAHYLDILIKDHNLWGVVGILRSLKFVYSGTMAVSERERVELVHESGLPLVLHRRLFRLPFYSVNMEEIWARSGIQTISSVQTRLLSPADNLAHICGSVIELERHESLRWVCDAWFLIHRHPDLDWRVLLDYACRAHLALPLFVTVGYLADALNAPIPSSVLRRLCAAASEPDAIGREAALLGVQTNPRGGLIKIIQNCADWPTRTLVIKWALFPTPGFLRWMHEIRWSWLLPLYYAYRPGRFIIRQLWFFCKRHLSSTEQSDFRPIQT